MPENKLGNTIFQTIVSISSTIAAAGIVSLLSTVNGLQIEITSIKERVNTVSQDRYTASDAAKDDNTQSLRINSLEKRVEKLER